ncbi:unnamed protein product [Phytophthora lilii]|uniref:Unnamed protein product n=1 Tax=Phytophthora lilii TaxID=2077276 RepID=A0A9W6X0S1_9STRA|nr:unnamed protein product [Phytophthora lilii]
MALTESTPRNSMPTNSPEILSKEQQELIEKRRREALERRKRAQHPIQPPAVIRSFPSDATRRALQPTVDSELPTQQQQRCSSLGSIRHLVQSCKSTRRVVTPDTLPAKNPKVEKEQVRPEYFWDDLEAAAEIVQWENEHMAEAAMKQPTPEVAGSFQRQSSPKQNAFEQQILAGETEAQLPGSSVIPSISQEIAAAAEIIQWENEHESPGTCVTELLSGSSLCSTEPSTCLPSLSWMEERV